jgi:hypothetical protein
MQPIKTFCTLFYEAKVSFKFRHTEMEPLLLFYHMSFASEARVQMNPERRQSFL